MTLIPMRELIHVASYVRAFFALKNYVIRAEGAGIVASQLNVARSAKAPYRKSNMKISVRACATNFHAFTNVR
jgi:hypothetical protein